MTEQDLDDRLAALIGQPMGSRETSQAPDPVNQPMIRHWAAAFEDWNPVYTDPDWAAKSRFGEIVAPPLMLQTWTMAIPKIAGIAERGGSPVEAEGTAARPSSTKPGTVGTLATNSEFEILRYLRLGDVISAAHDDRVDLPGKADQARCGPIRDLGHDVHRRERGRGGPSAIPDPQVQDPMECRSGRSAHDEARRASHHPRLGRDPDRQTRSRLSRST